MAEFEREVTFRRTPTSATPGIRVVGSGLTTEIFGSGAGGVDLITFGVEPRSVRVEGEPEGTFSLLDRPDRALGPVLYDPDGMTPVSTSATAATIGLILDKLVDLGVPFFQISRLETLGLGPGHTRQAGAALRLFQSQAMVDFENQTGIPGSGAFRIEGQLEPADIYRGRLLDVKPLSVGNFGILREGWNRAGLTSTVTQPENLSRKVAQIITH